MKKRLLCTALAAALVISCFVMYGVSVSGKKAPQNYIWVLEASGSKGTVLSGGRASGVTAEYGFSMRYASVTGDTLCDGEIPTRFFGTAKLTANYDFSSVPKIAALSKQADASLISSGFKSHSAYLTQAELPQFEISGNDGMMTSALDFHAVDTYYYDSPDLVKALGGMSRTGAFAGRTVDHGFGKENAMVYISIEPDELEIGNKTEFGVRKALVLVTVFGSESAKDECDIEITGTLKRVPYSPENLYGIMLSSTSPQFPSLEMRPEEGSEAVGIDIAVSRIKAYLSGGLYWPEALPATIPDFDEAEKITSSEFDGSVFKISAHCTWEQFEKYVKRLENAGFAAHGNDIFSPNCYIRYEAEKKSGSKFDITLNISLAAKCTWLEGFDVFPDFAYGCILKTPSGEGTPLVDDYAWMTAQAYGADIGSFDKYGSILREQGYKYDLNSYIKVAENGYRYLFTATEFKDEFGSGLTLSFSISKEGTNK